MSAGERPSEKARDVIGWPAGFRAGVAGHIGRGGARQALIRGAPLTRLDAGLLDHLLPLAELDLDEVAELAGRAGKGLEAHRLEPALDGRVIDDPPQLLVEPVDDLRRRARGRDDPGPGIEVEAGHAFLVEGRQL